MKINTNEEDFKSNRYIRLRAWTSGFCLVLTSKWKYQAKA